MSDEQIDLLEFLIRQKVAIHFVDGNEIYKLTGFQRDYTNHDDPDGTKEPVAWLSNGKCIALWVTETESFFTLTPMTWWPE